ncbi:MAG TPA: DNA-3-methyladenine glycosylase [Verrucomicrobiales bacterium]|nr:DNA-3-methyladenine glycosylase [Verrucomicrobiales bacterium]
MTRSFFERHPLSCARDLVGAVLTWDGCSGLVVETEAYAAQGDEACHTFTRPASRRFVAEHKPGDAYVYLNYGMYWLLNVLVKGGENEGFVLIRALQPLRGLRIMQARRGPKPARQLCSGPGRLSVALGIDRSHHGQPIFRRFRAPVHPLPVSASPRIGISRARDLHWRFTADENPHVSVPP